MNRNLLAFGAIMFLSALGISKEINRKPQQVTGDIKSLSASPQNLVKGQCLGFTYSENNGIVAKMGIEIKPINDAFDMISFFFDGQNGGDFKINNKVKKIKVDLDFNNNSPTVLDANIKKIEQENGQFIILNGTTTRKDLNKGKPSKMTAILECNLL